MSVVAPPEYAWPGLLAKAAETIGLPKMTGYPLVVTDDAQSEIRAIVVYDRFNGRDMEMSIASFTPRWCNRKDLYSLFAYPFILRRCARVTATTREHAENTRSFLERLGFEKEGVLRESYLDSNGVVYGMLRRECKWLNRRAG